MFHLEMQEKHTIPGHAIVARNVNHALPLAVQLFTAPGAVDRCIAIAPRGVETLELRGPLFTTYRKPLERVLFDARRDANPFFHLFESLWILAGRQDVAFLAWFLPRIADYSDNGTTFNAAYGYRLRKHFGHDQLARVVDILREDPDSRRATAVIFDPIVDHMPSKDIPCNTTLSFLLREGALNLTVHCRSNDLIWGCYGANVVQFSTVLEYVAAMLGVNVGQYTQVSNSAHVYTANEAWQRCTALNPATTVDLYEHGGLHPFPLVRVPRVFDTELTHFMKRAVAIQQTEGQQLSPLYHYENDFLNDVALPLLNAYAVRRLDADRAMDYAEQCRAMDWQAAACEWLMRRQA